jgi:uncharacterized protein (DUF1778 family)
MGQSQISAFISSETRALLERYARAHGVKKGYLIENALRHHIHALLELPADVIIPPRLVVSRRTGEAVLKHVDKPPEPTREMKALFEGEENE